MESITYTHKNALNHRLRVRGAQLIEDCTMLTHLINTSVKAVSPSPLGFLLSIREFLTYIHVDE